MPRELIALVINSLVIALVLMSPQGIAGVFEIFLSDADVRDRVDSIFVSCVVTLNFVLSITSLRPV